MTPVSHTCSTPAFLLRLCMGFQQDEKGKQKLTGCWMVGTQVQSAKKTEGGGWKGAVSAKTQRASLFSEKSYWLGNSFTASSQTDECFYFMM
eukprot:scaffold1977_cov250-Skeletonema_marinoi.AAC.4